MPRTEEYPEICKYVSVVTTCSMKVLGMRYSSEDGKAVRLSWTKTKHLSYLSPLDSLPVCITSSSICQTLSPLPYSLLMWYPFVSVSAL